jgi:hypothetical protein
MSETFDRAALVVARKRIGSREPVHHSMVTDWDKNVVKEILRAIMPEAGHPDDPSFIGTRDDTVRDWLSNVLRQA